MSLITPGYLIPGYIPENYLQDDYIPDCFDVYEVVRVIGIEWRVFNPPPIFDTDNEILPFETEHPRAVFDTDQPLTRFDTMGTTLTFKVR